MSYEEYLDLYLLTQDNPNASYYVISFDTINSKQLSPKKRQILQNNIIYITKYVYSKLLDKEIKLNKQILIKDERFFRPWEQKLHNNGNFMDPLIFGDCFSFTVLRDTISGEEIIKWVEECKINLNMMEEFHISDGYYETNEYHEGKNKFYRGYCLQTLETLHKPEIQKRLKKINNKRI